MILFNQTGWNFTLFSRSAAVPLNDRKTTGGATEDIFDFSETIHLIVPPVLERCDIGVRFSVRPSVFPSTIYVDLSI